MNTISNVVTTIRKIVTWTGGISALKRHGLGCLLALVVAGSVRGVSAQVVIPLGSTWWIAQRSTELLTTSLTITQRQALHAANFTECPASIRPMYLRAVAFDVGTMIRTERAAPTLGVADYVENASWTAPSSALPSEILAHKALVKEAMRELNALITLAKSNDLTLQKAIDFGAVDSFWDWDWWY